MENYLKPAEICGKTLMFRQLSKRENWRLLCKKCCNIRTGPYVTKNTSQKPQKFNTLVRLSAKMFCVYHKISLKKIYILDTQVKPIQIFLFFISDLTQPLPDSKFLMQRYVRVRHPQLKSYSTHLDF